MKRKYMLLLITATVTGLMAGLFFAWSVSVTPGIGKLPDKEYLRAFQLMNRAILNPLFFTSFFGAAILLPVSAYVYYARPVPLSCWLLAAAAVIYLIGIMGVTIAGNIPLNNALDTLDISSATPEQLNTFRKRFEQRWNQLNHVRTVSATLSSLLVVYAALKVPS